MTGLDPSALLGYHEEVPEGHRSGIVCLAGRPNVGKSTLLNAMVGSKVAIVTPVPGTTRNAIRGILTRPRLQLVFIDTPGLAKPRTLLGRRLNELVRRTWSGVDAVCLVVDAAAGIGRGDEFIAEELSRVDSPVVVVVNKVDQLSRDAMAPILTRAAALMARAEIVPTSATRGDNMERLVEVLSRCIPEGPRLFPGGVVTDQPERQLIAEVIREKFLTRVFEEVPHSIAVVIDELEEQLPPGTGGEGLLRVGASIYVERDSQKGIVIGRGGRVLRAGNTEARQELEAILGAKVFLDVRVKVAREWQRDPRRLERFGY
ncbi:MAG TPA: GTPase Era [Nitriliruptorales bacterium]|nr:GTPase Era [Nitriliruptorales bacterium]